MDDIIKISADLESLCASEEGIKEESKIKINEKTKTNEEIKINFFKQMMMEENYHIISNKFGCWLYDYYLRNWSRDDLHDDEIMYFKKLVREMLSRNSKTKELVNKSETILLTDNRRIFIMKIGQEKYNLKHDGTNYYV
jgi:hypothetical protein